MRRFKMGDIMKYILKKKSMRKKLRDIPEFYVMPKHVDRPESASRRSYTCKHNNRPTIQLTSFANNIIHIYIICNYIETFITLV